MAGIIKPQGRPPKKQRRDEGATEPGLASIAPLTDEAEQLVHLLTPGSQTIATLCKRLRMKTGELEQVVAENYAGLVACGVRLHVAAHSEVARAIKLASLSNADEPTYYSRISRQ